MNDDLLSLAQRIVERGRRGEEIEAFVTHGRDFQVKAYGGEIESLSSAEPRGAGIRVIASNRMGFAYTTNLTETGLDEAVAAARDNAASAGEDPAVGLAAAWDEPPQDVPGLVDPELGSVEPNDKVSLALDLERRTRGLDRRVRAVEESMYADSLDEVALATSSGIGASFTRSDAWCYVIAIATDGDDTEVGFEFDLARGLAELDPDRVAHDAVERAVSVLGAEKIPSERLPVVFDPYTSAQFLGVLGSALTAEAVQKGRSLFAGRLGEKIAGDGLSLIDDGSLPGAPGSSPWDAEGVPTGRTEVVRDGVLQSYLYDLTSARREGRSSTGNAGRAGFKSPPGPAPSNLAFDPTGESAHEVLRRAGKALYVQDFHGVHSGANPISGDFSVGATGRLLEDGETTRGVKEVTIAAPMLEILRGIQAVADDRRWLPFGGSYGGATTLVAEMTVAGR